MGSSNKGERYFMTSVKIGPKGQIVIPKEAREMFGLEPGDTIVLLADSKKGIALQRIDKLHPFLKKTFDALGTRNNERAGGSRPVETLPFI